MAYSSIVKPSVYFNTKLYTGNGSTQSITGVGFQPDWTWIKNRSSSYSHCLYDVVRTATKRVKSNSTDAEDTDTGGLTSFDSNGFSVGSSASQNASGENIVSWNWKAGNSAGSSNTDGSITSTVSVNTTAGFSIVKWTGTGSAVTVGHGLGQKPDILFVKRYSGSSSWTVYTDVIDGSNDYLSLNASDAKGDSGNPVATNSVFQKSDTNGEEVIAYCFASKTGYSKIGSYTGNGNADGTFVYTGFKPAFVLIKQTSASGTDWRLMDNKRSAFNLVDDRLFPNLSNAENTGDGYDFLSNGFKIRTTNGDCNGSGQNYIYLAFAEEPLVANSGTDGVPATAR
jgi:hypothetical protein